MRRYTLLGGCPYRAGEMVLLPFPAANRDPRFIADPDKIVIDRKENRHAAFGLGIHRCIGSNLARMELKVAWRGKDNRESFIPQNSWTRRPTIWPSRSFG
jgi:cytochrome P450